MNSRKTYLYIFILCMLVVSCSKKKNKKYIDWKITGGTKENIRYSSLKQIDTSNVQRLKIAWVYHSEEKDSSKFGVIECNPIVVDGILYGTSSTRKLFAIDASSGNEKWQFNPSDSVDNKTWHSVSVGNYNRGVAYWTDGSDNRIIYATGPMVYEVDALTGKLVTSFGIDGAIDLREGLGRDPKQMEVSVTSPVITYKNLFYVSGGVGTTTTPNIRGFDIKTGEQKWIFHTVPNPGERGYETWDDTTAYKRMGKTTSWSGFSLDERRGILYAPLSVPSNDWYGGDRLGDGLYGNSLVALDAATGNLLWHFQTVHHDVWDYDLPTPPSLITLNRNGKKVDAAVQTTKTGLVFVFDRVTGEPLFPIEEKPVPTSGAAPGERLSPTQPFPVLPKPFSRQSQILTENDLNKYVDDSTYQDMKRRFNSYRYDGMFTPPTEKGTLVFPGFDGGGEWGGGAIDPETNTLYVNANNMAWILKLKPDVSEKSKVRTNLQAGKLLYKINCSNCHGPNRQGGGEFPAPSLIGLEKKYDFKEFNELLSTGKRAMPKFNQLTSEERKALASFVLNIDSDQEKSYNGPHIEQNVLSKKSYQGQWEWFLTKEEEVDHRYTEAGYTYPAISPPWGTLTAINLNTGEQEWQIPFGEYEELKAKGIPTTGRENYGGPVVTAGGLIFIAATEDEKFRAISKRTGRTLYESDLPAMGSATPAVYAVNGKQYVVIACGGSKRGFARNNSKSDTYVAFSLKD